MLLVQPVAVGDVDELVVAHAALVGEERELRVALLAALADDLRVVVNVGAEVLLGAVVHVDVDLHERFVHRCFLHVSSSLRHASSHGSTSSTSCSEGAIGRTERMSARTKSSESRWCVRSVDHVKAVAHVDARPLVGQAHLLEEVGHALREVLVLALGILQVAHLGRLDVHEVHVRVVSLEQHATEEVEDALPPSRSCCTTRTSR